MSPAPLIQTIQVPGDKSCSHRAVLFGALATGTTTITGLLDSEDVQASCHAVQALGAQLKEGPEGLKITGQPWQDVGLLDCGNSGTTARLLLGALSGRAGATLSGDASLNKRPMRRVTRPLIAMGAQLEDKPCLPLTIRRSSLQGISYQAEVASAQVKSAVLLAGLAAAGTTTYLEPTQTRDHTERMLLDFGVKVVKQQSNEGQALSVSASSLKAASIRIPGDISSAAFWMVAACLLPGSRIVLPEVGINPTRTGVLKALSRMGASIALSKHSNTAEPTATLTVNYAPLNATVISGSEIPLLIDELPVLGVAAAFAEGTTEIRDAAELRVKESDRIRTLAQGLVACGVEVEELADGLKITGNPGLKPCFPEISSHGDHRIAMAFSIATLRLGGHISDTACIQTSYPSFFKHLSEVRGRP